MELYVCYDEVDLYRVKELARLLRAGNYRPWLVTENLLPGQPRDDAIMQQIATCNAFMFAMTPESVANADCLRQLAQAEQLAKPIVPVLLKPNVQLPPNLARYQYANFATELDPYMVAQLMAGIALMSNTREIPAVPAITPELGESYDVPARRWVITTLSPYSEFQYGGDNLDNVRRLVTYHRSRLERLYLVATLKVEKDIDTVEVIDPDFSNNAGVLEAYRRLQAWLNDNAIDLEVRILSIVDATGFVEAFEQVSSVLAVDAKDEAIQIDEIVIDITAGTKALSVGMTAAAMAYGCPITYQAAKRNIQGDPDTKAAIQMLTLDAFAFNTIRASTLTDG